MGRRNRPPRGSPTGRHVCRSSESARFEGPLRESANPRSSAGVSAREVDSGANRASTPLPITTSASTSQTSAGREIVAPHASLNAPAAMHLTGVSSPVCRRDASRAESRAGTRGGSASTQGWSPVPRTPRGSARLEPGAPRPDRHTGLEAWRSQAGPSHRAGAWRSQAGPSHRAGSLALPGRTVTQGWSLALLGRTVTQG